MEEFYPNLIKEKERLKGVLVNQVTKAELKKDPSAVDWPVPARGDVTERAYREWQKKCLNPKTNEYYLARDETTNLPIKGTEPRYLIRAIYRVKTAEDLEHGKPSEEVLLTKGSVVGHDSNGDEWAFPISFPEMWLKNHYKFTTEFDPKEKAMVKQCQGVSRVEKIYETKFNKENAKALLDKRISDKVQFVVMDVAAKRPVEVIPDVNLPKTVERFLKPFSYLYNADYLSPLQKAENDRRAYAEGLQGNPGNPPSSPPKGGAYS